MKIYIMRHGHAEQMPNSQGQRPLVSNGIAELEKLAHFLEKTQVSHVMHSEKLRAKQTAEIMAKVMAPEHTLATNKLLNPEKDIDDIVSHIREWHEDTLLVSHMPFVSQLVSELVTGEQRFDVVRFTPGTIVCLERCNGHDRWVINWVLRANLLP